MNRTTTAMTTMNVGATERVASGLLGAALVRAGLRRRSLGGVMIAAGGAALLYRGAVGRSAIYRRFGVDTTREARERGIQIHRAITVQRPIEEVYAFWRDLENVPRFMTHVRAVRVADGRSHWLAREGPLSLEWDAELVDDVPNERLRWRSLPGGDVMNEGTIHLSAAPGERGTELHATIRYAPPTAQVAMALAPLLRRVTATQLGQDLQRFKQLIETGELATADMRKPAAPEPAPREQRPEQPAATEVHR